MADGDSWDMESWLSITPALLDELLDATEAVAAGGPAASAVGARLQQAVSSFHEHVTLLKPELIGNDRASELARWVQQQCAAVWLAAGGQPGLEGPTARAHGSP